MASVPGEACQESISTDQRDSSDRWTQPTIQAGFAAFAIYTVEHPGDSVGTTVWGQRSTLGTVLLARRAPWGAPWGQCWLPGVVGVASECGRSDGRFSSQVLPARRLSGRNPQIADYVRSQRIGMAVDSPRIELQPFVPL